MIKNMKLQSSHGEIATAKIVLMSTKSCVDLETGDDVSDEHAVYIDAELAKDMINDYEANIKRLTHYLKMCGGVE